jgi:hypothetical protein
MLDRARKTRHPRATRSRSASPNASSAGIPYRDFIHSSTTRCLSTSIEANCSGMRAFSDRNVSGVVFACVLSKCSQCGNVERATEGPMCVMYSSIRFRIFAQDNRKVKSSSMRHCEQMRIRTSSGRSISELSGPVRGRGGFRKTDDSISCEYCEALCYGCCLADFSGREKERLAVRQVLGTSCRTCPAYGDGSNFGNHRLLLVNPSACDYPCLEERDTKNIFNCISWRLEEPGLVTGQGRSLEGTSGPPK